MSKEENKPYYKEFVNPGWISSKRAVEVQDLFCQYETDTGQNLIKSKHGGPDSCELCGEELPKTTKGSDGWKKRIRHFETEHKIQLIGGDFRG